MSYSAYICTPYVATCTLFCPCERQGSERCSVARERESRKRKPILFVYIVLWTLHRIYLLIMWTSSALWRVVHIWKNKKKFKCSNHATLFTSLDRKVFCPKNWTIFFFSLSRIFFFFVHVCYLYGGCGIIYIRFSSTNSLQRAATGEPRTLIARDKWDTGVLSHRPACSGESHREGENQLWNGLKDGSQREAHAPWHSQIAVSLIILASLIAPSILRRFSVPRSVI